MTYITVSASVEYILQFKPDHEVTVLHSIPLKFCHKPLSYVSSRSCHFLARQLHLREIADTDARVLKKSLSTSVPYKPRSPPECLIYCFQALYIDFKLF